MPWYRSEFHRTWELLAPTNTAFSVCRGISIKITEAKCNCTWHLGSGTLLSVVSVRTVQPAWSKAKCWQTCEGNKWQMSPPCTSAMYPEDLPSKVLYMKIYHERPLSLILKLVTIICRPLGCNVVRYESNQQQNYASFKAYLRLHSLEQDMVAVREGSTKIAQKLSKISLTAT
jgi:hypothetical protein